MSPCGPLVPWYLTNPHHTLLPLAVSAAFSASPPTHHAPPTGAGAPGAPLQRLPRLQQARARRPAPGPAPGTPDRAVRDGFLARVPIVPDPQTHPDPDRCRECRPIGGWCRECRPARDGLGLGLGHAREPRLDLARRRGRRGRRGRQIPKTKIHMIPKPTDLTYGGGVTNQTMGASRT